MLDFNKQLFNDTYNDHNCFKYGINNIFNNDTYTGFEKLLNHAYEMSKIILL